MYVMGLISLHAGAYQIRRQNFVLNTYKTARVFMLKAALKDGTALEFTIWLKYSLSVALEYKI